jgi:hypothetical protein
MRSSILIRSAVLLVALASSACAFDTEGSEKENVADTSDELLQVLVSGEWTSNNWPNYVDMGPDNDRTCFLTAITGELRNDFNDDPAEVSVKQVNGRWELHTWKGYGDVRGTAMCINKVANRVTLGFAVANQYFSQENTPHRQCFISGVKGTSGWLYPNSFGRLHHTSSGWTLLGYLPPGQAGESGGSVDAVCVDIPRVEQIDFSYGNPASPLDLMDGTTNTVCGITGISGNWYGTPMYNGIEIWPDGGDNMWKVATSTGKLAFGTCLRGTR